MTEYIPILILDEDDTPKNDSMTLKEFLEIIDRHTKNVIGANPENIYVTVKAQEYEDYDTTDGFIYIGEISFSVKR